VGETIAEGLALDEFQHEAERLIPVLRACGRQLLEAVDLRDMRMIERGQELGFAAEASKALGIALELRGQNLDRDLAF
jgi:hypothetical protein